MEKNKRNLFKPDEEEIENQRKEILLEINKSEQEIKKEKRKKVLLIGGILLIFIVSIKIFFGTIEIYNIFGYPQSKARFYKVTINDEPTTVGYTITHKIPVIPFLINFNSKYIGANIISNDEDDTTYKPDNSEKFIIDIDSYSCYSKEYQVECKNDNQEMKNNNDTRYTNLQIVRTNNPYEEIYNGKFVNDITEYVKTKGYYYVGVTAKHSLTETVVYFYFERK